jgi:transcriptional regulator with PAS, ATPase and Fis domain
LLDEVADLPLELQAKILRVLEQREVQPLGESRPVAIDVRVISAAQEPLSKAVEAKRFRADLYARLDGMMVKLPALRERNDEVPALFTRFLAEAAERAVPVMTARVVEALCIYDWPLNVRELRLIARRTVALHGDEPVLHRSHLPERVYALQPRSEAPADKRAAGQEIGLERLVEALRTHDGVVARAAHALGISRQRAYRLMRANPELDLDGLRKDADEKVDP